MRSFLAIVAVGLVGLAVAAFTQHSSLVYSLGVNGALQAAQIAPGTPACQGPVRLPSGSAFDRVGFMLATPHGSPPVRVEVRAADSDRVLASGRLDGGYAGFVAQHPREQVVEVGRVDTATPLDLCLSLIHI